MSMSDPRENAKRLGDKRFLPQAKNLSVLPGGPQTTNPENAIIDVAPPTVDGRPKDNLYRDGFSAYPQEMPINPGNVSPSEVPQFYVPGNLLNAGFYNQQPQPNTAGSSSVPDIYEVNRLNENLVELGLETSNMGPKGSIAIAAGMPGDMQGTSGPPLMQGLQSAEMAAENSMNSKTPGATPIKRGKSKNSRRA